MTANEFVYWLQGFLEVAKPTVISAEQTQEIKNHIGLVLTKVTPDTSKNPLFFTGIQNQQPPAYEVSWIHGESC